IGPSARADSSEEIILGFRAKLNTILITASDFAVKHAAFFAGAAILAIAGAVFLSEAAVGAALSIAGVIILVGFVALALAVIYRFVATRSNPDLSFNQTLQSTLNAYANTAIVNGTNAVTTVLNAVTTSANAAELPTAVMNGIAEASTPPKQAVSY